MFLDEVHWDASDKKILALYTTYSKLIRSTWWTKPAKSVVRDSECCLLEVEDLIQVASVLYRLCLTREPK